MKFINTLRPGLRGKLSLFIGVMLLVLIGVILAIVLKQQRGTIYAAAEAEVTRFLRPVEILSLEIDQTVENLIRLEELRLRVQNHERQMRGRRDRNYYDAYFGENVLDLAEDRFRAQIRSSARAEPIDERRFEQYLQQARWFAIYPRRTPGVHDNYAIRRIAFWRSLRQDFDYEDRLKLGFQALDLTRYRAESINLSRQIRFDTVQVVSADQRASSEINRFEWGQVPELRQAMDDIHTPLAEQQRALFEPLRRPYQTENATYFLVFRTLFRNPEVSERATLVARNLETGTHSSLWRQYVQRERTIIEQFQDLAEKIRGRTAALRESQPVVPPFADRELMQLLGDYDAALEERAALLDRFYVDLLGKQDPGYASVLEQLRDLRSDLEELPADASTEREALLTRIGEVKAERAALDETRRFTTEDSLADAFLYLRDAALFNRTQISYKADLESYSRYCNSQWTRARTREDYANLRSWILRARSETYAPAPHTGGRLLYLTRSEAQEQMFQLDTTPLDELAGQLLYENAAGFTRILMDQTEARSRIVAERDRFLDTSLSIGFRMIFLAFLLSGALVQTIRQIIGGAQRVGRGELNVHFDYAGRDEFGDLVGSLNSMVRGLREREELRGELSAAEEIQKQLIPTDIPKSMQEWISCGMFYKAMHGVGGDYFDLIRVGRDEMAIAVADVSNHGVGPAIVMTLMRSQLHGILRRGVRDPREILLELNERTYAETPENIFITIFLGVYNRTNGELRYCSAGHNAAYVYRYRAQKLETMPAGGMPIGAVDNDLFADILESHKMKLGTGDLFFQYTDGVNEAMDDQDRLFGNERLEKILQELGRKKPAAVVQAIAASVERFTKKSLFNEGPSELNDDIAMVAFRRLK